jgi:hypothetical protein
MTNLALDPKALELLSLWYEERGTAPMAAREFINPLKLRRWVGDISVVHLHDGPKRFFVSLHGANVVRHLGPTFHKKYLEDEVPAKALSDTLKPYEISIETKEPTYSVQRVGLDNGLYKSLERMVMPCSGDDPAQVERFLVWVAPIRSNSKSSASIYAPFESTEMEGGGAEAPDTVSDVFRLSDAYLPSPAPL